MSHVRGTTFALLIFHPDKYTASNFIFARHLFLLLFLNMYTHKFKDLQILCILYKHSPQKSVINGF